MSQEAERLGFDSVWVAESWGNDAFTFAAWVAAHTNTIKIGTGVVQLAARTPTATAMAAMTLDHLSQGRVILGLGVSGPQVVEGWYGRPVQQTAGPHPRVRRHHPQGAQARRAAHQRRRVLPVAVPGRRQCRPRQAAQDHDAPVARFEIPIYLGAEGPKNVAQTVEIADGWLPLYYSPYRPEVYADQLRGMKPGFEIASLVHVNVTDDVSAALWPVKATLGFYIGGMGAKGQNYHTKLMARMGFEEEAYKIQDLFFAGKRDEAIAAVPEEFADEISIVGPPSRIKERLEAWRSSAVTTLLVSARDAEKMKSCATSCSTDHRGRLTRPPTSRSVGIRVWDKVGRCPRIPKIVSVDDHVIEPPHVWTDRGCPRSISTSGRVSSTTRSSSFRTSVACCRGKKAATRRRRPDGSWWYFEDLHYPMVRTHSAVGYPARPAADDRITYDEMIPGVVAERAPPRRHGTQPHRVVAVLPVLGALLRAAPVRGQGQGPRAAVRAGVQRLDGRGVVRRRRAVA